MSLPSRVWHILRAQLSAHADRHSTSLSGEACTPKRYEEAESYGEKALMAGYYANLELPYGAGAEAVRAARRRLVKRYHPDRFVTDEAKAQTAHLLVQNLNVAHDELLHYLARRTHE